MLTRLCCLKGRPRWNDLSQSQFQGYNHLLLMGQPIYLALVEQQIQRCAFEDKRELHALLSSYSQVLVCTKVVENIVMTFLQKSDDPPNPSQHSPVTKIEFLFNISYHFLKSFIGEYPVFIYEYSRLPGFLFAIWVCK